MLNDLRHRLKTKYICQQFKRAEPFLQPIDYTSQVDEIIARELLNASLVSKMQNRTKEDDFTFQGQRVPIPAIVLEVLYDMLKKYTDISVLQLHMKDEKVLELSLE